MCIERWVALIAAHRARYPLAEPLDCYKFLYQGGSGAEHLLRGGEATFTARLAAECAAVAGSPGDPMEPLWEPLRPDGQLGRLNLRPYLAGGGEPAALARAALRAAELSWGTKARLQIVWETLAAGWAVGTGSWAPEALSSLTRELRQRDYPAVHHSPAYRNAYRPAYRLTGAPEFIQKLTKYGA